MKNVLHKHFSAASFSRQLTVTLVGGVFCLALFSSLAISWWGSKRIRDNFIQQGIHVTEGFAAQSGLSLLYGSADNAKDAANATLSFPDAVFVEIRDIKNKALITLGDQKFVPDVIANAPLVPLVKSGIEHETGTAWIFRVPVYTHQNAETGIESPLVVEDTKTELLGYVRVAISKNTSKKMVADIFIANGVISLAFATGLLMVLQLLTRRLTGPLTQLSQAMHQAEKGESMPRAAVQGPKEVATMAHAFNKMMGVLEDRESELRMAWDQALENARAKSEFATTVSHEIRTPMNGVLGMLEILRGMPLSTKQLEYVEIAHTSAEALLSLINNILDFSKMDANKLELENVDFDLREIIEQVINLMAIQTAAKKLGLGYVTAPDVPLALNGDPTRLRQVIVNLIGNAIKFTEQGEVAIHVSRANEQSENGNIAWLLIEVSDTGIGISPEAHDRIFGSFSQVDSSTTRKYGGSGLGLTICKKIVEAMGGQIGLTSSLGNGSTFWVKVPLAVQLVETAESKPHSEFHDKRALLIAKSPILLEFLERSLGTCGITSTRASDGDEVPSLLRHAVEQGAPYGLLLTDLDHASVNPVDFARRLRSNQNARGTRLIVMVQHGELQNEGAVEHADIDAYISKPLRYYPLLEAVRKALAAPSNLQPPARHGRELAANKLARRHVLIAEDNRTNQIVATGLLDRLGCTFEVVANGHEAVIAVQERSYDAILMDCNMPEMDGYQACAYIRELQSSNEQQVAIIAMTANAQQAEVEKCRSVGMNRHIAKPLSLAKVRQALEECLLLPGQGSPIPSPTTTDVRTEEAAIDIEVMQQLREALGGGASEMIKVFLEDTPVYLDQLQKAVAADDFEAICAMAHTIKGSGSNFGANQLAGFCAKLEEAARARSQEGVPELISSCVDEYAKVSQALRKEGGPVSIQHVAADEDSPLILIVDDDRTTQIALRHALDAEGFRVEVVSNGEEAISAIGKISPELILMDAIMPVMDGFATTRQLARMPGSEQVPVLMITSLDDPASIDLAFAAGAIDYIPKPIHFAVLTHRIKQIVNARRAEGKVRRLAYHDSLTGLPNRVRFLDHVSHTLQRHGRENRQLAILFLDLDRFKLINDTLGHNIGDELLKAVGMRITHALRGSDMLARLGGDEFTVVLEDLPAPKIAGVVAGKICKTLGTPFSIGGHEIFVGISIGISLFPSDGANVSSLLKNADTAMYRAKKNGNGFLYYEEGMGSTFSKKLLLENSLRRALERNEMEVFYQPKYSLERNCTIGAEALVRWRHPSEGLISPLHFIPLAEESGLIIPIGEWVMRTACAQIKKWLDAGFPDLTIAVNLSVRQIVQANFVEVVARVIHETGIPAHLLELEITESVLMENAKEAMQSLQQLRDMGVTLAVDDFGTGYSSFAYLKRLPISVLKIDRTFIRDIDALPDDAAIVTGMIVLAHTLRLQVVAEGVETATQEAFLREKGCDMIQGYYLSEPIPAAQFEQRVLKSPFPKPSLVLMWDQVQS